MGSTVSIVKFTFHLALVAILNVHLIKMSGGSLELRSSNFSNTTENDDKSSKTNFVDAREDPTGNIPTKQSRT